ncbi:MAG: lipid-A-disaccharide synthase-related protein [Kovacikia sp.]
MRLLCLSNGHGEDAIALRILQALQQQPNAPSLEALPIVGEGHAYTKARIPLIGSVKTMPSGGFIYMDGRQLARDIGGGLLQLTLTQLKAIRAWARARETEDAPTPQRPNPPTPSPIPASPSSIILAVGDIVPLLFAWLSGLPYAFIGTAKSEYYLRDETGWLPRESWWSDRLERATGCVYHPWERWLMSRPNCKAVFPRDSITAKVLKQYSVPAFDLGNPMMDGIGGRLEGRHQGWEIEDGESKGKPQKAEEDRGNPKFAQASNPVRATLTIALLPGSRPPEAYANWETILLAVNGLIAKMGRPLKLLAAIAPGLDLKELHQIISDFRWQQVSENAYSVGWGETQATLVLAQDQFAQWLRQADLAISMAGTATEQFVGLGKPVITIPGKGPQFTPAFAEAQTRLLGPSVTLVAEPAQTAYAIQSLFGNPDRLQLIAENGGRRMGESGAAQRIANCLMNVLEKGKLETN